MGLGTGATQCLSAFRRLNLVVWSYFLVTVCLFFVIGCNKPTPVPLKFPQYEEPVAAVNGYELYYDVFVGELLIKDGCLRLAGTDPKFPEQGYLLVWPPGFSLHTVGDSVRVVDNGSVIVARVGDSIRVGVIDLERQLPSVECAGPYLAVGEEVRAVVLDERGEIESPGDTSPATLKFALKFPQHELTIMTDDGDSDYLAITTGDGDSVYLGDLLVEDGCLRLVADSENVPDNGLLLVWPPGYSLDTDADPAQIVDNTGLIAARVGDSVRVSGINSFRGRFGPADLDLLGCAGPRLIIGDEVHAVTPDEPTEIKLPGSTLFFPRQTTMDPGRPMELPLLPNLGTLELDGDCLRWRSDRFPQKPSRLVVWPPGFTPHIEDGKVVVRNGGGRTVARTGEQLGIFGHFRDDYGGKCKGGGTYWVGTVRLGM